MWLVVGSLWLLTHALVATCGKSKLLTGAAGGVVSSSAASDDPMSDLFR